MVTESSETSVNNLLHQTSRLTRTFDHPSWDVMALPPRVILAVIKINPFGAEKKIQLPVFTILPYITSNRKGFLGRVWHLLRHFPVLINPCFIDR